MLTHIVLAGLLLQIGAASPAPTSVTSAPSTKTTAVPVPTNGDPDPTALLKVKRIYVDSFGDDMVSRELQSMIVSGLVATKRFKVTENRERADAVFKGVALERTSQELHAYGESTAVGGASGGSHSEINGAGGVISGSSSGGFIARHLGTSDSSVNTETINEARIAVRLVNPDGDVIWTTTQESKGAKYKGASADVADKCVKQLLRDQEKLAAPDSQAVTGPATPDARIKSSMAVKQ
jgi:curli biogenesis system outer membrane secretion channel CsgG